MSDLPPAATLRRVCVFCGSSAGARPEYAKAAAHLGRLLAERGLGLVYGAGSVGLMGVLADAALGAGGEVIGVIPEALALREVMHEGLADLRIVQSMHQRKALMADLSDAFIALPGGFGTLEELCEVLTWSQLGFHRKPLGLLDVAGYWRPLRELFDHAVAERFLRAEHRALVLEDSDAAGLLDKLTHPELPAVHKWIRAGEE